MSQFLTMGGKIKCTQCKARSKRTKQRCRAPAMQGKEVCRTHGGLSTGPRTEAGRRRCAEAKTIHGRETRAKRAEYRKTMRELRQIEEEMVRLGIFVGSRTPGKKPE